MSDVSTEQAPILDLIISPALYKRGNNDGGDYQTVACCVKMEVVCNASRLFLGAKNPMAMQSDVSIAQEEVDLLGDEVNPSTPAPMQLEISTSGTVLDQKFDATVTTPVYANQPSLALSDKSLLCVESGDSGRTKQQKRKRKYTGSDHVASDDENDDDYQPEHLQDEDRPLRVLRTRQQHNNQG